LVNIYPRRNRFLFDDESVFFCHINTDSTGISTGFSSIGTSVIWLVRIGIGVKGLLYYKNKFL
jgi:hypothetical protein